VIGVDVYRPLLKNINIVYGVFQKISKDFVFAGNGNREAFGQPTIRNDFLLRLTCCNIE